MIHVLISHYELSDFLFKDLKEIDTIFVPVRKHNTFIHRAIKAIYYHIYDKVYSYCYPADIVKRLKEISSDDCLIVVGEDTYTYWMLSHICSHITNKVAYFWNTCSSIKDQKKCRRICKHPDKSKAIVEYIRSLGFKMATFDRQDSINYNMAYFPQFYRFNERNISSEIEYDFFFCGRDKGRKTIIEKYESLLSKIGNCNFIIVDTNNIADVLGYYEYLKQIENSRIICEVVQKGQSGLTVRALEALFFEKKLITNNESIIEFDFYDSNNIFIFRDTTSENDIKNFLSLPIKHIESNIKKKYEVNNLIKYLSNLK